MVTAKKSAIIYIVLLSLALLVPAAMIFTGDHEARSQWERRTLDKAPSVHDIIDNPKAGFAQFDGFMDDHVGFGFQAIRFRKRFLFNRLGVTGDKYIVGNGDGAFFMTAPTEQAGRDAPFQWFRHNCSELVSERGVDTFRKNAIISERVLGQFGAKVIFTAAPTKSVLLADQLPRSAPKDVVAACKEIDAQNNGMMKVAAKLPDHNFYYPYDLFKEKTRSDDKFFPNTAYHWAGESTWTFVEDFARTYDLALPPTWPQGPCRAHPVRWDIGKLIGVNDLVDGCNRDSRELRLNVFNRYEHPLNSESKFDTVRLIALTNPYPANDRTAVLVSNSFGPLVREQMAGLFKTTYHMNLNALNDRDLKLLMHESDLLDVDYVIIVVADFHYPNFLNKLK